MIEITFLGTSSAIPTSKKNHSATLLRYGKENILVDCGEGTQRQFRKAKINPTKITKILITHWHGDHVLGIPGLLQTLSLNGYNKTLNIYGPKGTKKYFKNLMGAFVFEKNYEISLKEISSGRFFEDEDFYLESEGMTHGIPCNAYSFIEKDKLRINKKRLEKTELPQNELIQKLKMGKDISYKGKKYKYKDLTFKEEGKKISFVLDTSFNKKIVSFVKNSDILICESSLDSEMENRAKETNHLTSKQVGEIAKKSKSKKLALVHISPRYEKEPQKILNEAKKIFKNTIMPKDLDTIKI